MVLAHPKDCLGVIQGPRVQETGLIPSGRLLHYLDHIPWVRGMQSY